MRLLLIIIIAIFTQCKSQQNTMKAFKDLTPEEQKRQGYLAKERDTVFIKDGNLDIKTLEEKGEAVGSSVPTDEGWKHTTAYHYEETKDDLYIYINGDNLSGYSKEITKKGSWVVRYYGYDTKGFVKRIGSYYPEQVDLGVWYDYIPRGLVRIDNLDALYGFSWEQVLAFVNKEEIKREDIHEIRRWVDEETKQPFWLVSKVVERDGLGSPTLAMRYTLNGNSGKLIKEEKIDVTRHLLDFDDEDN